MLFATQLVSVGLISSEKQQQNTHKNNNKNTKLTQLPVVHCSTLHAAKQSLTEEQIVFYWGHPMREKELNSTHL